MSGPLTAPVRFWTCDGKLLLGVRVVPGASVDGIRGVYSNRLRVAVTAPAEKGRANRALLKVLARMFALRAGDLRVQSGHGKRDKVVAFSGMSETELTERLVELLSNGEGASNEERT